MIEQLVKVKLNIPEIQGHGKWRTIRGHTEDYRMASERKAGHTGNSRA
jgi:hypothetical protein